MKKVLRIGVTIVICAAIVVGYYYYLSRKNDNQASEEREQMSEVDKIISRDFNDKYPTTPREVVKWYNRIITAYYKEEYSDEELDKMADQARMLMDEELLSHNSKGSYIAAVKTDIENYKNRKRQIVQSKVCDSNDIRYATVKGYSCAYVNTYYFVKEGSDYTRSYQEFVLRKDSKGNWKILTFRLIQGEAEENEQ